MRKWINELDLRQRMVLDCPWIIHIQHWKSPIFAYKRSVIFALPLLLVIIFDFICLAWLLILSFEMVDPASILMIFGPLAGAILLKIIQFIGGRAWKHLRNSNYPSYGYYDDPYYYYTHLTTTFLPYQYQY